MRALTAIYRIKFLAVFSLLMFTGCAQNSYSVKEGKMDPVEIATLRDISVLGTGNETRIEITADKPLTFTSYLASEPKRTVLDLSQADQGNVVVPNIESGSIINRIDISKNDLAGGSLVRIVIESKDSAEFIVNSDANDKRKIIISVAKHPQPVAQNSTISTNPESDIVRTKETAVINSESEKSSLKTDSESKNTGREETRSLDKKNNGSAVLQEIEIQSDGILLKSSGSINKFRQFTLEKPQRLAIDLFDVKSELRFKRKTINTLGIQDVRIGVYPEKVRLVLDSKRNDFPKYTIVNTIQGLKVVFKEKSEIETAENNNLKNEKEKTAYSNETELKEVSTVESIDFKLIEGFSRIIITTKGTCTVDEPRTTRTGYVLTLKNCSLPKGLQKPFDTSAFKSSVKKLTFYQSRNRGRNDTKVLIALYNQNPITVKRDGDVVIVDVKNNEAALSKRNAREIELSEKYARMREAEKNSPVKHAKYQKGVESYGDALHFGTIDKKSGGKIYNGKRVTLEFVDADIRKLFQLIAEVSNMNILVGDDVSGTITIKLVNVPWDQALDVILDTKALGMKREGNIIQIRPKGKLTSLADDEIASRKAYEKTLELQTRVFDINFADVRDIQITFTNFKSERGSIIMDARTNRVIVNDVKPAIERMEALLKEIDIPEKQVLIEARIVEATTSFTQDIGIQWGIHWRDPNPSAMGLRSLDTNFGGIVGQTPNTSFPITTANIGLQDALQAGSTMGMIFGKLANSVQLNLRLSAAAEDGLVKIISTPKVVTLNNKAAKITQGQMIPYATVSAEGTKVEFIEAALTLEVTPHITPGGAISLKIKASNNSAGATAAGLAPPINKKEATTELLLSNGETTVIGGIYVDQDIETDSGVPGLKDVPVLGWLFKSNNIKKTKTELLIFITPKIVN